MKEIIIEKNSVYAEAGALVPKLARLAYENSLTGLEFAAGIPGSFGGGIYMNSGAHGGQISDLLSEITYIDENLIIKTIKKADAKFEYRNSIFQKNNWIILSGKMQLEKGIPTEIKEKMNKYLETRMQNQPLNMPSAGSVFRRGENYIAAKLIDECGLKGYNIGDAEISKKHAGFIVNKGNGAADDVLKLIDYIKQKVKEKYDVDLETEIEIIGE